MSSIEGSDKLDKLWEDAMRRFREQTGVDLNTDLSKDDYATLRWIKCSDSLEDIMDILDSEMKSLNSFRVGDPKWGKLRNAHVKPFIDLVLSIGDVAGDLLDSTPVPGGKLPLIGLGVLLKATKAQPARYDALLELFEELIQCLRRLGVRVRQPATLGPASEDVAVEILVHTLTIISLATKLLKSQDTLFRRLVHFGESIMKNQDIQTALGRLKTLESREPQAIVAGMHASVVQQERRAISAELRIKLSPVDAADIDCQQSEGCKPDTHATILRELQVWSYNRTGPPIFWLEAAAGSGKSAIAREFGHRLAKDNRLGGSFFCSREKSAEEADVRRILPTLAASLASLDPIYHDDVLSAVQTKPMLAQARIKSQIETLLQQPLSARTRSKLPVRPFVFLIDALDQCADGDSVQELLNEILSIAPSLPVKFFLTSRPEPQIRAQLDSPSFDLRLRLPFYEMDLKDISLYLTARLRDIYHELERLPDDDWLSDCDEAAIMDACKKNFTPGFYDRVMVSPARRESSHASYFLHCVL